MNEERFAWQIKQHLDQGVEELDPQIAARLKKARQHALARQRVSIASGFLAGIGNINLDFAMPGLRMAVAIIGLAAGVGGVSVWNHLQALEDADVLGEVDTALLTDDLPLDAYLDKGFGTWLTSNTQQ